MANWDLIKKDGSFYVEGLQEESFYGDGPHPDTYLLCIHDAGDCDSVSGVGHTMHRALYDLYQCTDGLKDGDTFSVDGEVVYRCQSFHVVPVGAELARQEAVPVAQSPQEASHFNAAGYERIVKVEGQVLREIEGEEAYIDGFGDNPIIIEMIWITTSLGDVFSDQTKRGETLAERVAFYEARGWTDDRACRFKQGVERNVA